MKKKIISDIVPDPLLATGFDDAIIGVTDVFRDGENNRVLAYDRDKILEILVERAGMDELEAEEHFAHNIVNCYVGKDTPIFIQVLTNCMPDGRRLRLYTDERQKIFDGEYDC